MNVELDEKYLKLIALDINFLCFIHACIGKRSNLPHLELPNEN